MDEEEVLTGGNSNLVTRVGETVRRSAGPWTPAVHALLEALREAGITEVPQALGMDERGRHCAYNMVFRDRRLAALIDFDTASPGRRVWDFSYLAYRLVPLGENGGGASPEETERWARLDALIEAYGAPFRHADVFETLEARLNELAEFTDGRAVATGRADFLDHAAMYRRDRDRVSALATMLSDR